MRQNTAETDNILTELKSEVREMFSDYEELAGGRDFRYHHLVSVHKYSRRLVEKPEIREKRFNQKAVEIAAILHDIGRSEDIEDGYLDPIQEHEGHADKGAKIAGQLLEEHLNDEEIEKIEKIIRNHHSEPGTVEGKVLQDADLLFKYGSHDLWRMFHYAYRNKKPISEVAGHFEDMLRERLEEDLEKFHFDCSRKVAEKRLKEQSETVERIEIELNGSDI